MFGREPVIAVCGPGCAGKDEVAKHLSTRFPVLAYQESTSAAARELVFDQIQQGMWEDTDAARQSIPRDFQTMLSKAYHFDRHAYATADEFHAARRNYREFWADWILCYNNASPDHDGLYTLMCRRGGRILTGIRRRAEFQAVLNTKLCDLSVWIMRSSVPHDPTMEFTAADCDFVIVNPTPYGQPETPETLAKLHAAVDRAFNRMAAFLDLI